MSKSPSRKRQPRGGNRQGGARARARRCACEYMRVYMRTAGGGGVAHPPLRVQYEEDTYVAQSSPSTAQPAGSSTQVANPVVASGSLAAPSTVSASASVRPGVPAIEAKNRPARRERVRPHPARAFGRVEVATSEISSMSGSGGIRRNSASPAPSGWTGGHGSITTSVVGRAPRCKEGLRGGGGGGRGGGHWRLSPKEGAGKAVCDSRLRGPHSPDSDVRSGRANSFPRSALCGAPR